MNVSDGVLIEWEKEKIIFEGLGGNRYDYYYVHQQIDESPALSLHEKNAAIRTPQDR